MIYYKIPHDTGGTFDYPSGCILCCSYYYDGYMYCKFESVATVGSDWVAITESEFNVRCPDFPVPDPGDESIDADTLGGKGPEEYAAADHEHLIFPPGTYGDSPPEDPEDGQFYLLLID